MTRPRSVASPSHIGPKTSRPSVWLRPSALNYGEELKGYGGIVSPLLAGFSLLAIATIATSRDKPPFATWAAASFAAAVGLLLFAMQVSILSLGRSSSPDDILMWRPEATVSDDELRAARAAQARDLLEMARLARLSFRAYGAGLVAFLSGVLLLMIPRHWTLGWKIGVAIASLALFLELWWLAANRWQRTVPHPVTRLRPVAKYPQPSHRTEWAGAGPPELDAVGLYSVLDVERLRAATTAQQNDTARPEATADEPGPGVGEPGGASPEPSRPQNAPQGRTRRPAPSAESARPPPVQKSNRLADACAHAQFWARRNSSGIGVSVTRASNDGDERAWQCIISDGYKWNYIRVIGHGIGRGSSFSPLEVEEGVTRFAEGLPEIGRLRYLRNANPLRISRNGVVRD